MISFRHPLQIPETDKRTRVKPSELKVGAAEGKNVGEGEVNGDTTFAEEFRGIEDGIFEG
jgi:hypothetical protein